MSRRKIQLLLAILFFVATASAWGGDFRERAWGESEDAIRASEEAEFLTEATPIDGLKVLVYSDSLAGLNTFVVYILAHDQLVHTKYLFAERHTEGSLYLADFARIEDILREQHGEPVQVARIWREGAREEDPDPFEAIAMGDLALLARWETETTHFIHVIHGENLQISHEVDYVSKHLDGLEAELIEVAEREIMTSRSAIFAGAFREIPASSTNCWKNF